MKTTGFLLLFLVIFIRCLNFNKRIEITSEYIINEHWDKRSEEIGANSITIKRMNVKRDSLIDPFSELSQEDILKKLEVDSSFIYTANIKINQGESYKGKKIFFNKDNGFYWWTDQGEQKIKVLGKLQPDSWYEISGLTYYYYVVYVDSTEKVHQFPVNVANY